MSWFDESLMIVSGLHMPGRPTWRQADSVKKFDSILPVATPILGEGLWIIANPGICEETHYSQTNSSAKKGCFLYHAIRIQDLKKSGSNLAKHGIDFDVAQARPQIDAEFAKKGRFRMKTNYILCTINRRPSNRTAASRASARR